MHILMAASEMAPLAKSGGLGDVVGSLPGALARLGHRVTVVMPFYRSINADRHGIARHGEAFDVMMGEERVSGGFHRLERKDGVSVWLVAQERFYHRDGLYGDMSGTFGDNDRRFIFLSLATLEAARRLDGEGKRVDVFHGHDWHVGLVPVYFREGRAGYPIPSVFSIHNLKFQGRFPPQVLSDAGLSAWYYSPARAELWGSVSFLKAGLEFSEFMSTVSEGYAREIQTYEYGEGLADYIWHRREHLVGIRNGIDTDVWNPATDPYLGDNRYDARNMDGKDRAKQELQQEMDLPERDETPLIGVIARLEDQKGADLILSYLPWLLQKDVQFVLLGTGSRHLEDGFRQLASQRPQQVATRIAFDDGLAHRIEAGADLFMMPSRFEPCGLNHMYSLRYGTAPIVRAVGGLDDVVVDLNERTGEGNGFKFRHFDLQGIDWATSRALSAYANRPFWRRWRRQIMGADFSWDTSARQYVELYEAAITRSR